jgi:WD40 repeat protein
MLDDAPAADGTTPTPAPPASDGAAEPCLEALRRLWPADFPSPGHLGRFEVLRELGRGGMGVVFLAFDPKLGCKVALKVPLLAALLSDDGRRRFLNEARAAAKLDHPNIVPIREAGEEGALCYIASAYCEGPTLAAWLAERGGTLPPREAAELVATLADAVEYMHGRDILHRDLKPSNILMAAGAGGLVPRITDFGLAKVRDGAGDSTSLGAGLGTPAYMAPEQASGAKSVGRSADVYALGVILYELLTGRPPLVGTTQAETLRLVVAEDPLPLRRLRREVARDLEAICLKCLQKKPDDRYSTAKELADDLRRFLSGESTRVRPVTALGRAGKWVRRRPAFASLIAVTALAVLALVTMYLGGAGRRRQEPAYEEYAAAIRDAWKRWEERDFKRSGAVLDLERRRRGQDLRGFEWYYLNRLLHPRPHVLCELDKQPFFAVALSRDGKLLAAAGAPNSLRVWDTATWKLLHEWPHDRAIYGLAFSPDGKTLASAGGLGDHDGKVELREVATGDVRANRMDFPGSVDAIAYSNDGQHLVVCGPAPKLVKDTHFLYADTLKRWDKAGVAPNEPGRCATSVAFSPLTNELAVGMGATGRGGVLRLRGFKGLPGDMNNRGLSREGEVSCVCYSPVDNWLAFGSADSKVSLQRIGPDGKADDDIVKDSRWWVRALRFAPDGRCLAAGHGDGSVRLWDMPDARERRPDIPAHETHLRGLTFSRDGQSLVTASEDGTVKVWDAMDVHRVVTLPGHKDEEGKPREVWCVAFSPDGNTLASSGDDGAIRLWDAETGKPGVVLQKNKALVMGIAFSRDGKRIAAGCYDHSLRVWDIADRKVVAEGRGHTERIRSVAFSPDGKTVASAARDRRVRLWDADSGEERALLPEFDGAATVAAFSPDGKLLAAASTDGRVRLWDALTRAPEGALDHGAEVHALAFSPDSGTLATGDHSGVVRFWDLKTREFHEARQRHEGAIRAVAFSRDGRTVATAGEDKVVRLWQAATGEELLTFPDQPDFINSLAFSPGGTALAAAVHDGTVRIWRAPLTD